MEHPANLLTAVSDRREYLRAFADVLRHHNHANAAVINSTPELVGHFTALAKSHLEFARALRTGDWSRTRIRPLSFFIANAKQKAA